jgi:hypothetical protein
MLRCTQDLFIPQGFIFFLTIGCGVVNTLCFILTKSPKQVAKTSSLNSSCLELQERLQTRGVFVYLVFPIIASNQWIKEAENFVNFLLVYYFQGDFVSFLGFYL